MLEVVGGGQGAPSGIHTFLAVVHRLLRCDTPRRAREIQQGRRHTRRSCPQEQSSKFSPETALECVRRAIWGMLYGDEACILLQSPRGLGRMMAVFVEIFGIFRARRRSLPCRFYTCTGNAESLQLYGATVPLDNLLHLFGRRRH